LRCSRENEYHELQKLGEFDRKTSSWVKTPADIRKLGGALFGDRRFGRVFIYHNGAQSYYSARGRFPGFATSLDMKHLLTALLLAPLALHAVEPPHILVREALQFENIGDSGRVPGTIRLLYQHLPEATVTLWPWQLHEREGRCSCARFRSCASPRAK